jgi:hypothetical protein
LDDHDHNGDRVFGSHTYKESGYKLLVIGCTNTNHVCVARIAREKEEAEARRKKRAEEAAIAKAGMARWGVEEEEARALIKWLRRHACHACHAE